MSGPKLIELRRMQAARERQRNHDRCASFGSEYARLLEEFSEWEKRLSNLCVAVDGSLRPSERVREDIDNLLRQESHHEAARIFGEEVNRAGRLVQNRREAFQERLVTLQNRHRELLRASESIAWERDRLAERMEAGIPAGWPEAEQRRLHIFAKQALEKVIIPSACALPENPETIAQLELAEAQAKVSLAALESARKAFESELNATQARLLEHLSSAEAPSTSLHEVLQRFATPPAQPDDKALLEIEKPLAELASHGEDLFVREARQRAEAIRIERDATRRKFLREALLIDCSTRLKERRQLARWREEVQQLIDSTAHIKDSGVDAIVSELRTLTKAGELEPIKVRLQAAVAAAEARREREHRRRALIDSLKTLGYETNENLETAFVKEGRLVWRRPHEDEYAVEVVADRNLDQLQTALVRYSDSDALTEQQKRRDYEHEESWCADHAKLRAKMAEHGLETPFKMQLKPGEHPVKVIVDQTRKASGERAAAAPNSLRKNVKPSL